MSPFLDAEQSTVVNNDLSLISGNPSTKIGQSIKQAQTWPYKVEIPKVTGY